MMDDLKFRILNHSGTGNGLTIKNYEKLFIKYRLISFFSIMDLSFHIKKREVLGPC